MKFGSSDKELIAALFATQDWLDLYMLHERFRLSPGQITNTLRKLSDSGLVETQDLKARFNSLGRRWVLINRKALFLQRRPRSWARPDRANVERMLQDPLSPYMPQLSGIKEDFFSTVDGVREI